MEIVAINDLGDKDNLLYLLKYDSVYGKFNLPEKVKDIKFLQEKDPAKLPWKDLGVDVVLESTGCFETFEKAKAHLDAGAKRVLLSAPAKDEEGKFGRTILMGMNDAEAKDFKVTSNASCTTNASLPVIAVLAENPGIEKAVLNTIHAMTNTQTVVDTPVKGSDMRRGRAASQNLIPSTTGAAIAVTKVFKELEGKFDGIAIRCPIITGSLADITFIAKRKTSVEEINKILKEAAESPRWKGILKTSEEDIVSSDIIKEPYGAVVDLKFTKVIDGNLVKILSWYDNEWGYAAMLIKHIEAVKNLL
jgi:glyceraldehyde 3-phosphate dehydrogenase